MFGLGSGPPATRYKCRRPVPDIEMLPSFPGSIGRPAWQPTTPQAPLRGNRIPELGLWFKVTARMRSIGAAGLAR